jgi:hypothetical protein
MNPNKTIRDILRDGQKLEKLESKIREIHKIITNGSKDSKTKMDHMSRLVEINRDFMDLVHEYGLEGRDVEDMTRLYDEARKYYEEKLELIYGKVIEDER